MQKRLLYLGITSIGLIILVYSLYNYTQPNNLDSKLADLKKNTYILRSIRPNDTIFNDLIFLDSILQGRRIILLGEQLHYDGATFAAKSRIIRYLYKKLGYNVVLYEAGLYDMWYMATNSQEYNPSLGLYNFWWDNEECKDIWEFYREKSKGDNPIFLGGFDIQLTGKINDSIRKQLLETYLESKDVKLQHYPAFADIIERLDNQYLWELRRIRQAQYDSIKSDLNTILTSLKPNLKNHTDSIYYRYLSGVEQYQKLMWNYNPGDIRRMNIRDSIMADNLSWLLDSVYKNNKVIVWCANIHALKNNIMVESVNLKPMGKYIKDKYANTVYTITATSYGRYNGNGKLSNTSGNKGLEYLLYKNNNDYTFVNLAGIEKNSFLKTEIISAINQKINFKANWSELTDGILFINAMTNPTPINR